MRYVFLFSVLVILSIGIIFGVNNIQRQKITATPEVIHSSRQSDKQFYEEADAFSAPYIKKPIRKVYGGIIPHHLLAAPLIAGFFKGIARQEIKRVILLSPDHYNNSPYPITTAKGSWRTAYGNVGTDTQNIEKLSKSIGIAEPVFDNEHGIFATIPFIKKTFPKATVIPVIFKSTVTKGEADNLVSSLTSIIDDQTIIVASVDFSHYLPLSEANEYDKESIAAIQSFDTEKIFTFNNVTNMDSPKAIYTLTKVMKEIEATKADLIAHTNSAILTGELTITQTTSYVTVYFGK